MTGRQIHVGSQRAANYLPQMSHQICLFTFAFEAELDRYYFDQSFLSHTSEFQGHERRGKQNC